METFAIHHLGEKCSISQCHELLLVKNKEEYSNPGWSESRADTMLKYTFLGKEQAIWSCEA